MRRGLALAPLALVTLACPGRLEHPERFADGGFECSDTFVEQSLLKSTCVAAGCHQADAPAAGLDLESPDPRARLRGASSCGGASQAAFLLEKVSSTPRCGAPMPQGRVPLSPAERACVRAWLAPLLDGGPTPDAGRDAGAGNAGRHDGGANEVPVLSGLTAPATAFAGQLVPLTAVATDPDGDELAYSWTQPTPAAPGDFSSTGGAMVTWSSPVTTSATPYTLSVSVTDGLSAPVTRTVTVTVGPTRLSDVFSAFLGQVECTGCHGGTNGLTIGATPGQAWTALVNVAHHQDAGCVAAGITTLVVPGDPARSLLMLKVGGGLPDAGECGVSMPFGSPSLPRGDAVALETWIRLGAPND